MTLHIQYWDYWSNKKKKISDSNIKHMEAVPTVVHINYSICYM